VSLYNFEAARAKEQLEEMQRLDEEGICIFCPEHIHKASQPIEIETDHWMVKKNDFPYANTDLHLILIPKVHVPTAALLPKAAQMEFMPLVVKCETLFQLGSYALAMRSGDMRFNGGSIEHLHAHIIVGDVKNPDHQPVKVKVSSRPNN
jgi:ATP adenylyltransferase